MNCRAHAHNCLAIIAQHRGNLIESERLYAKAFELASKAGDVRLLGMIEQNRGVLLNMRGNFVAAEARLFNSSAFGGQDERCFVGLNNLGSYTKNWATTECGGDFERGRYRASGRCTVKHPHPQLARRRVAIGNSIRPRMLRRSLAGGEPGEHSPSPER